MKNDDMIYDEIEYGEETDIIFEKIFFGEILSLEKTFTDMLQGIQVANEFDERDVFLEGLINRLDYLGVNYEKTDIEGILKELKNRYKNRMGKAVPRTVKEWVRGIIPGVAQKYRRNLYELCYALEMDVNETAEFFIKNFMTVPYNYKDRIDAIFFYCILNKKTYDVIEKMIEKSNKFIPNTSVTVGTQEIGRNIVEIDDDDEFLKYIELHCYNNEQQYQVARNKIKQLVDEIKENLVDVKNEDRVTNLIVDNLFDINYQQNIKRNLKANSLTKKYVQDDKLPKRFVESIPRSKVFKDILNGKYETYETLRKTIIILYFYTFFDSDKIENFDEEDIRKNALDFYEEINKCLFECGMAQIYVRHPFDYLMCFCAMSLYPIDTFHELNKYRYKEL